MTVVNSSSLAPRVLKIRGCLAEKAGALDAPFPLCGHIADPELPGAGPGMIPVSLNLLPDLFH